MSDIYVPGIKSRFDTEKIVEGLMKIERIPKERSEKQVEQLQTEKTYWQDLSRRMTTLRDSARFLYSFQNPFNERMVNSSDPLVLSGTSTREAVAQEFNFTIKQIAQADRFLSDPLEDSFTVGEGTYTFSIGNERLSFPFRGGSLREFIEILNRRGRDKLGASLIAIQPGKKSLLIESRITGVERPLVFSEAAEALGMDTGMLEHAQGGSRSLREEVLTVEPGGTAFVPFNLGDVSVQNGVLQFELATTVHTPQDTPLIEEQADPPPEALAEQGSEENRSFTTIPSWTPLEPGVQINDMRVLYLTYSDGTNSALPPIADSHDFTAYQYRLADVAGDHIDKTIVSLEIINQNTHREVSIRNLQFMDTEAKEGIQPRNPVSVAQDAVVTMEGIEIIRPTNKIDDLIPGLTITVRSPSDKPIQLKVEPDQEAVKDAIISLVGNYNRLMADLNVLTRNDERVIQELSYLSEEEQGDLRKRLGVFAGDSILGQFKNSLQRAAAATYPTAANRDLALLAQIGIGTDVRGSGSSSGYDPARLRGYLEINEKTLDTALQTNLSAIAQLFGSDTDGDLIVDSGIAYTFETLAKPFVEIGGIIALKTGTIDSQISQEQRRVETLERQLALKEASLKIQYGQMEGAYNRMERMSSSLDQFSQQGNRR
ncbi:MAG: flagellar filament capping protein FliD [Treponema sp.]|jgi:flagellar hook-associated protein 2|nr:flagellar filament capping protein FliD [Treponema sp.]